MTEVYSNIKLHNYDKENEKPSSAQDLKKQLYGNHYRKKQSQVTHSKKNSNEDFDQRQLPLMNSLMVELEREDKKHRQNVKKEIPDERNEYFMRELETIKTENKELRKLILSQGASTKQLTIQPASYHNTIRSPIVRNSSWAPDAKISMVQQQLIPHLLSDPSPERLKVLPASREEAMADHLAQCVECQQY